MYLWNVNELVKKLKNNTLPRPEVWAFYLLSPLLSIGNIIFFSILLASHHFTSNIFAHFLSTGDAHMSFYNLLALIAGSLTLIISCIGLYLCYQTNKNGDGKHFFKRMACLSFPVNFHLTIYLFAFLSLVTILGFLFLHGKIILFKQNALSLIKSSSTIGEAIQEGLKHTTGSKAFASKAQNAGGIFKAVLGAPVTVLKLPSIPGQINKLLTTLRSTALTAYPVLVFLPPVLSFFHYFIIRRMLKSIS